MPLSPQQVDEIHILRDAVCLIPLLQGGVAPWHFVRFEGQHSDVALEFPPATRWNSQEWFGGFLASSIVQPKVGRYGDDRYEAQDRWSLLGDRDDRRLRSFLPYLKFYAVLHKPPVSGPVEAVRAAIASGG